MVMEVVCGGGGGGGGEWWWWRREVESWCSVKEWSVEVEVVVVIEDKKGLRIDAVRGKTEACGKYINTR